MTTVFATVFYRIINNKTQLKIGCKKKIMNLIEILNERYLGVRTMARLNFDVLN